MSVKTKAALTSYLRVWVACIIAAYLELGKKPLDLNLEDGKSLLNAAIGALVIFAFNWARPGETRFGRGAKDIGMGGDDALEVPEGKVQAPLVHDHEVGEVPFVEAPRRRRSRG